MTSPGIALKYGRMITGADLHPSGTRVAIRTYTGVFEYRLAPGGTPAEERPGDRLQRTQQRPAPADRRFQVAHLRTAAAGARPTGPATSKKV